MQLGLVCVLSGTCMPILTCLLCRFCGHRLCAGSKVLCPVPNWWFRALEVGLNQKRQNNEFQALLSGRLQPLIQAALVLRLALFRNDWKINDGLRSRKGHQALVNSATALFTKAEGQCKSSTAGHVYNQRRHAASFWTSPSRSAQGPRLSHGCACRVPVEVWEGQQAI